MEKKTSFSRIEFGKDERPAGSVRPYYFPDIPLSGSRKAEKPLECFREEGRTGPARKAPGAPPADAVRFQHERVDPGEAETRRSYARGLEEGRAAGRKEAYKCFRPILRRLVEEVRSLEAATKAVYRSTETGLVDLAVSIAEKIVAKELSLDRGRIVELLSKALEKVENAERIRIRVHPEDLEILDTCKAEGLFCLDDLGRVEVTPDIHIQKGGCMVESNLGTIDGRLEKQFEVIQEVFRTELAKLSPLE